MTDNTFRDTPSDMGNAVPPQREPERRRPEAPLLPEEVSNELLALLARFAGSPGEKLTDSIRVLQGKGKDDRVAVQRSLDQMKALSEVLGRWLPGMTQVDLYASALRLGTLATPAARAMLPAVEHMLDRRSREAPARRLLEELQLASSISTEVLSIGGYPAHWERFLARAVADLHQDFPWIKTNLRLFLKRERKETGQVSPEEEQNQVKPSDGGDLAAAYANGEVDYMMVPADGADHDDPDVFYSYNFRVLGTAPSLSGARERRRGGSVYGVHVDQLHNQVVLCSPPGHSSYNRLVRLCETYGVKPKLRPEESPLMLRVRAQAGEGLAVVSDEYESIANSRSAFPPLLTGTEELRPYKVGMKLQQRPGLRGGVHEAWLFVLGRLRLAEMREPTARPAAIA